jgi:hypothetical protein
MWSNGDINSGGRLRSRGDIQCQGNIFGAGYLAMGGNLHGNDRPGWEKAQW